jgi:hypothetical protein
VDGWREEANSYPVPNGHDQPVSPTRCRFSNSNLRQPFRATISGKVTANDNADSESVQEIRAHLTHIAVMFSNGDFSTPMFVHSQVPPGVPTMQKERADINYTFEELPAGGSVRIKSSNVSAIKAVHEFLRFQIEDHHTGDSADITC